MLVKPDSSDDAPLLRPPAGPSPPFDRTDADLIIRSADGVEHRVLKVMLANASQVFSDMFSTDHLIPESTPLDNYKDDIPIVEIVEDAKTLDGILRCCYPVPNPTLTDLTDIVKLYEAAEKYEIDAVRQCCMAALALAMESSPVRSFAVAYRFGLEEITKAAMRRSLSLSLEELLSERGPELDYISVAAFQNLLWYRRSCRQAWLAIATRRYWVSAEPDEGFPMWIDAGPTRGRAPETCCSSEFWSKGRGRSKLFFVKKWWTSYLEAVTVIIGEQYRTGRNDAALRDALDNAHAAMSECPKCRRNGFPGLRRFADRLSEALNVAILEVDFKLNPSLDVAL